MTTLNVIFHKVVSDYWFIKLWNSPQFPAQLRNDLYTQVIWFRGLFGARPERFPLLNTFEVYVYCEALCDIFDRFFLFDFLKRNSTLCQIYWIPDSQSLKLVCFMVAITWKQKYEDSRLLVFGHYIAMFIKNDDVWKHFKYWLSSSNLH